MKDADKINEKFSCRLCFSWFDVACESFQFYYFEKTKNGGKVVILRDFSKFFTKNDKYF